MVIKMVVAVNLSFVHNWLIFLLTITYVSCSKSFLGIALL